MMRLATIAIGCCVALSMPAAAQYEAPHATVVDIWPANAPGLTKRNDPEVAKDYWVRNVHNPSLTIFRPKHQNGAAMIVIPGGGHKLLVWTNEGINVAQALSRYGLTVFVLKYRLAQDEGSTSTVEDAANDVANAPPAFITAGTLDDCCATPAVQLYEQLRNAHRDAELHMYAGAGHAFNLDETSRIAVIHWPDRLADWLADEGFLDGSSKTQR
jgi:acetyl esterase/lipase